MQLQQWLVQFGAQHVYLIYLMIVLIALAEGPILSVLLGVLLRLNHFYFLPVYISLMLGDLIGDVILYHIGYHYGEKVINKLRKYFTITEEKVEKVKMLFHDNKYKILFFSKISNGLGLAMVVLTTAGIVRIPFWKYIRTNILGQLLWSGALLALGYFFGELYTRIHGIIGKGSLIAVLIIAGVFIFHYLKRLRKKLE
ncbi:MAG: hypothetical protein JWM92_73 [Candidatus Nomurabacteria bacterium]|jgi:membrane protein DedA with SNARE-associated domain|nr:hypothetical protein [Candidatus Nomurabacteria bacterium]